ncbi:MAG: hypothetical protein WCG07_02755 [Candidatus Taylorbacteria bacterium]
MVNMLNLRKEPKPTVVVVTKPRSFLVESLKMLTVITVVTAVVYGISRAADITPPTPKFSMEQSLTDQITRYQNFLKNMPGSISANDQATLTTEITTAITHLKTRLDNAKNPVSTFSTTTFATNFARVASTTRINSQLLMKNMSTSTRAEMRAQRIATQHKTASTTQAEMKVKQQARMQSMKDQLSNDKLLSMKVNALIQAFQPIPDFSGTSSPRIAQQSLSTQSTPFSITNFTLSPTTSISSDTIHSIITANSTSTLQSLIKDIPHQRKLSMESMRKTKMLARQTEMNAKMLAMQDKMKQNKLAKLAKLASTTPEVATTTVELATTTEIVATSTPTQTASVIDALPVSTSTDTASSTQDQTATTTSTTTDTTASSTENVASSTPEVAPLVVETPAAPESVETPPTDTPQ